MWEVSAAGKALHGVAPPGLEEKSWRDCPGGIDFTHPDFATTIRMSDKDTGMSFRAPALACSLVQADSL